MEVSCFMVGKRWCKAGNAQSDFTNLSGCEPARRGAQGDQEEDVRLFKVKRRTRGG